MPGNFTQVNGKVLLEKKSIEKIYLTYSESSTEIQFYFIPNIIYTFWACLLAFTEHVYWLFLITQKHVTTENPTSANSNWQNSQCIFNTSA